LAQGFCFVFPFDFERVPLCRTMESAEMLVGRGVKMLRTQYLAGLKDGRSFPTVPILPDRAEPAFVGTLDDVARAHPLIAPCLYNEAKICAGCGKPCVWMLTACNSCGERLGDAPTKTENVFAAFMLGVSTAGRGFPYQISLRRSTEHVLIFDDMLSLTPCHFNAISAKYYIPNWTFLLRAPRQGLELLDLLEAEIWTAAAPFVNNLEFRKTMFRNVASEEDIQNSAISYFNCPPSIFQMHVQWMLPPLMPYQHFMVESKRHFPQSRAFPMTYVRQVLALDIPYDVQPTTLVEDIVKFYNDRVNYESHWRDFFQHCVQQTLNTQNWDPDDFDYVVQDGKAHKFQVVEGSVEVGAPVEQELRKIQAKDKAVLQNYGRPVVDGKSSGTYTPRPILPQMGSGGFQSWAGSMHSFLAKL